MTVFQPPPWTLGTGHAFKATASAVAGRTSRFACPAKVSLGSRKRAQSLQPNDATRWRREWDDASSMHFAIRDAQFAVARGTSIEDAAAVSTKLTDAQRRFVVHALHELADLPDAASSHAGVALHVDAEIDYSGQWGAITVFGAHLTNEDGTVREVVRLRLRDVKADLDPGTGDFVAVAGWVLAKGANPNYITTPERVRVSEFSLDTGDYQVLFDGTTQQAEQNYLARGRPVQQALDDQTLNPGSGCSDCDFLNVCPAVPQIRGALGIPGRAIATRALSATDLAAYDRCPTAFHVQRRDYLPPAPPEGADGYGQELRERGIAAHRWLNWAHSREPRAACTEADLPDPRAEPEAAEEVMAQAGMTNEGYLAAWPYLRQHLKHCLLGFAGLEQWRTEPVHVVYDPDADVVAVSSPDLTCRLGAKSAVWRETKTANVLPPDVKAALTKYPAFALNVALLAAGADSNHGTDGAAELEVLTPTGSEVFYVPLSDGALVAQAQRIVAEIANAYSSDSRFAPKPTGACRFCDAYGWCLPPAIAAAPPPEIDDDEFANLPDPF